MPSNFLANLRCLFKGGWLVKRVLHSGLQTVNRRASLPVQYWTIQSHEITTIRETKLRCQPLNLEMIHVEAAESPGDGFGNCASQC